MNQIVNFDDIEKNFSPKFSKPFILKMIKWRGIRIAGIFREKNKNTYKISEKMFKIVNFETLKISPESNFQLFFGFIPFKSSLGYILSS